MTYFGQSSIRFSKLAVAWLAAVGLLAASLHAFAQASSAEASSAKPSSAQPSSSQPRVIEVLADKDSHFKVAGQNKAQITVKAGERILLRIDARKGKTWNRDGVVHGFTMLRMKDRARVPDWDFELTAGMHEYSLTAPSQPGEYEVLCTVICSGDHDGMRIKVLVV